MKILFKLLETRKSSWKTMLKRNISLEKHVNAQRTQTAKWCINNTWIDSYHAKMCKRIIENCFRWVCWKYLFPVNRIELFALASILYKLWRIKLFRLFAWHHFACEHCLLLNVWKNNKNGMKLMAMVVDVIVIAALSNASYTAQCTWTLLDQT